MTSPLAGIMIFGTPRSGTTLLRRLMDAHPNIACPGETNVFTACGRFLRADRIAEGVRVGALDGLAYAGFEPSEILSRLREMAFWFHQEYAARQGKPRWASKTAFDSFYLNELEALCSDHVRYVCIQRHGLDVACSMEDLTRKNGGFLPELHEYVRRHPMTLEAFAHAWVDLASNIRSFAQRHLDNALLVTYEDLVSAPNETMESIMSFVGERWSADLVGRALEQRSNLGLGDWKTYARTTIDASSVGRWRKLSRDTIRRLAEICNPTLMACGYQPVAVDEQGEIDVRRRYELGLLLQGMQGKTAGTKSD